MACAAGDVQHRPRSRQVLQPAGGGARRCARTLDRGTSLVHEPLSQAGPGSSTHPGMAAQSRRPPTICDEQPAGPERPGQTAPSSASSPFPRRSGRIGGPGSPTPPVSVLDIKGVTQRLVEPDPGIEVEMTNRF